MNYSLTYYIIYDSHKTLLFSIIYETIYRTVGLHDLTILIYFYTSRFKSAVFPTKFKHE